MRVVIFIMSMMFALASGIASVVLWQTLGVPDFATNLALWYAFVLTVFSTMMHLRTAKARIMGQPLLIPVEAPKPEAEKQEQE